MRPRTLASIGLCMVLLIAGFGVGYATGTANPWPDPSSNFKLEFYPAEPKVSGRHWVLGWRDEFEFWSSDRTNDGSVDSWAYWVGGSKQWEVQDRNGDRKLDYWFEMTSQTEGLRAEDNDYDGVVDQVRDVVVVKKY